MRALELWEFHRDLVIPVLDARAAAEAYRLNSTDPRGMSPEQVDWMTELDELAERVLGEDRVQERREREAELIALRQG